MIEGDTNDFIQLPIVYLTKDGLLRIEELENHKRELTLSKQKESNPDRDHYLPVEEDELEYTTFTEIEDATNRIYTAPEYSRHINKSIRLRDIAEFEPSDYTDEMSVITLYSRTCYTLNTPYNELVDLINKAYGNS